LPRRSLIPGVVPDPLVASVMFAPRSDAGQVSTKIDVQTADLNAAPPATNWLTYHRDYSGFSASLMTYGVAVRERCVSFCIAITLSTLIPWIEEEL
jgi:hypothetical protein